MRLLLAVWLLGGCDTGFQLVATDDAGADGGTTDAGSLLQVVHDDPDGGTLRNVFGVAADEVHAIGDAGKIVYWDGTSFSQPNLGSGYDLTAGWGLSKTDQWITAVVHGTPQGMFFHKGTAAMGRWIQASANVPNGLLGVFSPDGATWFASGYNGAVYTTDAMGPFHTGVQFPASPCHGMMTFAPMLWQVSGNNPSSIGFAGDQCTGYFWDGSMGHALINSDATTSFRAVFGPRGAATDLYFGGNYYGLYHFDGTNLETKLNDERDQPGDIGLYIRAIWGPDARHIVCVGDAGRIMTLDAMTEKVTILPSPTTRVRHLGRVARRRLDRRRGRTHLARANRFLMR